MHLKANKERANRKQEERATHHFQLWTYAGYPPQQVHLAAVESDQPAIQVPCSH